MVIIKTEITTYRYDDQFEYRIDLHDDTGSMHSGWGTSVEKAMKDAWVNVENHLQDEYRDAYYG